MYKYYCTDFVPYVVGVCIKQAALSQNFFFPAVQKKLNGCTDSLPHTVQQSTHSLYLTERLL